METATVGLHASSISNEEKKAAASLMGSIKTPKKASASRGNLAKRPPEKMGGLKPTPLSALACTCGAGEALEGHRWDCPRGQAIKRRIKEGRDVQTGEKLPVPA